MLKKDELRQDMFLIGPPGDYKRRLVNLYAHLTSREIQFLQISRDTTEADIKQRREIVHKSAVFFDQASVRCALGGHVLVLDGIEKAERNVLPLLNNLLENREMNLEDGRHLIPHTRFDALLKEFGADILKSWKLERVHEDFRIIALGLPVPTFKGNPLDPPLRSRFQARNVQNLERDEVVQIIQKVVGVEECKVKKIIDLAYALNFSKEREFKNFEAHSGDVADVPWFVVDNLIGGAAVIKKFEEESGRSASSRAIFKLMYPFKGAKIDKLVSENLDPENIVPGSTAFELSPPPLPSQLESLEILRASVGSNISRGILLYGPQGCGKSTIAEYLGHLTCSSVCVIQVYKDMSVRELFQSRTTDKLGNTIWRFSPLTNALLNGDVCVLDGVENLHHSVFSVIGKLVQDGDVLLPDGVTRIGGGGLKVHPSFRLIGIANSSDLKLTPELTSVFFTKSVEFSGEDLEVLCSGFDPNVRKIVHVGKELAARGEDGDKGCGTLARALSFTQIKRINRGVVAHGRDSYQQVYNACLGRFLPGVERDTLVSLLGKHGVKKLKRGEAVNDIRVELDSVVVGGKRFKRFPDNKFKAKVPDGLFFNINAHVRIMEGLLTDFFAGDHLLVIGNQGVGKNKIVDRMLQLVNAPREYIQLHRDTTVQSLTSIQRVEDGVIVTEDSPLVNAAKHGLVLVIDEADKAPAHVTAVLKTLAERGEMFLPDGRFIGRNATGDSGIPLHPDFRMIVLANRPGFPFLGNNFYSVLSHLFSVNPVSNPGVEDEVMLLKSYGPDVDDKVVRSLAACFSELRQLSDDGVIAYPYSTREAVHVVKHLQSFPGDMANAFGNVFDFDSWNDENLDTVGGVITKFFGDLAIGVSRDNEWGRSRWGNTWAGGSGGTGTAGLGGAGGPYRLTDGNPVFQVSPEVKASVPPEIRLMARDMARKAFEEKLKELKMSKYDGNVYEDFIRPIRPQIQSLRTVLESLQSNAKERKWVKHQTSGEFDDSKLIEGVVGEKNIYRTRKHEKPEVGDPIVKPKLLRLLVDCSGSMYRFNGYDRRMDRTLSSLLMVMNAFKGFENTVKYDVFVHSGDEFDYQLVGKDSPPANEKEMLDVLKYMFLHSQFCASGDNTLEATIHGVKDLGKIADDHDDVILLVLSDANLERYGISAKEFARVLTLDNAVKCFCVFIGSLGDQASRMEAELPAGKSFVCLDTSKLPKVIQKIFMTVIE
ncbi:von Willebrand factor A domain-containing protein 8 [Orchesella cincta]|uniref:von Willebrand factor A domain-containing protein 8 n=1 Tax=Orchesella cincta TaxID=48709 RepID=A0A1D2NI75_ORCCI|nr:von Willebrand factor A domain-containing protein 8 [Orchesella cincta]